VGVFVAGQYFVPEVLQGLGEGTLLTLRQALATWPYTFVLHDARKLIALEPLPNIAKCTEENVNISGLADVAFVMGNALLGPLLISPKGRNIIGRLAEGIRKGLRR